MRENVQPPNPYLSVFAKHPTIRKIANTPAWTVSDKNKRPIDMLQLRRHIENGDAIWGASLENQGCTETIPEVLDLLPDAANLTFALDARRDNIMVLDIEPICPDEIKAQLLNLPYLYGEYSSSGRGYHLILPLPRRDDIIEVLNNHSVLKQHDKYYEFLLCHWCMFTGKQIPPAAKTGHAAIEHVFDPLLERAKSNKSDIKLTFDVTAASEIQDLDDIIIRTSGHRFEKTPADFGNDMSRFEFYQIHEMHKWLWRYLCANGREKTTTASEAATMLYAMSDVYIKHRPKHDTLRRGEPYLLYQIRTYLKFSYFGLPESQRLTYDKERS